MSAAANDPPARKSKGLAYYLSLFAKLTELASTKNTVLLLDDPAIYLHPLAQKRMLPLLDSQPFQTILATHLPFMIDPDHIERVRVVARPKSDSQILSDWFSARESLLPVWGSLLTYYGTRTWLVVEGHNDKRAYLRMSTACTAKGLVALPQDLPIVPAGGDQAHYLVSELTARGMSVAVLVDGDAPGRQMKAKILRIAGVKPGSVVSLDDVGLGITDPYEQKLFESPEERNRALSRSAADESDHSSFDKATLDRFAKIFTKVNEALKIAAS